MTDQEVARCIQRDVDNYDKEIANLQKHRKHLLALGVAAREFLQSPQGRRLPPGGATTCCSESVWLYWQNSDPEDQPGLSLFLEKPTYATYTPSDATWPGDPDVEAKVAKLLARIANANSAIY